MRLSDFDYELPAERIAQEPLAERDAARLLLLHRTSGNCEDRSFRELPGLLRPGDLLVANESRVVPARLFGQVAARNGPAREVEILLLQPVGATAWEALARPARRLAVGARVEIGPDFAAEVVASGERGLRQLRFQFAGSFDAMLQRYGHVPLPPYIRRQDRDADRERYQTVFARQAGSAAAPTAGLHFTPRVLEALAAAGVEWTTVTLHVGLGTFQSVTEERIEAHAMHRERYEIPAAAAAAIGRARREGRRVMAVGTTAARVLETVAAAGDEIEPGAGETELFLYPGRPVRLIEGLLTNFHAPRTTLLMLVAAFAGWENMRRAYAHALAGPYRFLSYGDCMLIQ